MVSISGQAPLIKIYLKHYNMDNNTNKKEVDMEYSLKDIIAIKTSTDVANYLKSHTGFSLNEKNITFEDVVEHFRYVGDNASNYSTIHILKNGEKGVVERITNAIDAVLEKNSNLVSNPVVASDIVSKAFPKWFENPVTPTGKNSAGDASNAVQVVFNDGSKNRPTIDIIDKGTGIMGGDFSKTILSLHGGNKINKSKSYLTGAFGHGGSTSLGFTNATLIISKCNGQYFFTIVKSCDFADSKLASYVYMIDNGNIPVAKNDVVLDPSVPNEIKMFIDSESGTFVRMIELDASSEWKSSNIGDHIFDYFNTELYNPCIPVKLIERRAVYSGTGYKNNANRFVFGAARSLDGSKFYHKDKSGTIEMVHNGKKYQLHYSIILPENEDEWGMDSRCRSIFQRFCVYNKPIIYTINGQYITSENFTKIKNGGLSNLQYRLLVEINLDHLENEKYKFFTTNRDGLQNNELTKGFIDSVVRALCNNSNLKELNSIIAEKSMKQIVDDETLDKIKSDLADHYKDFIKPQTYNQFVSQKNVSSTTETGDSTEKQSRTYEDEIENLTASVIHGETFFKNETVELVVKTNAWKSVNQNAQICCFVDGKQQGFDTCSTKINYMNGRVVYSFNDIPCGNHSVQFGIYDKNTIESNIINISVLNELGDTTNQKKINKRDFSFNINLFDDKELIMDLIKNDEDKSFTVNLCLTHELMQNEIYSRIKGTDIASFQRFIIEPITKFVLGLEAGYTGIEQSEDKNKMMIAYCKSAIGNFIELCK